MVKIWTTHQHKPPIECHPKDMLWIVPSPNQGIMQILPWRLWSHSNIKIILTGPWFWLNSWDTTIHRQALCWWSRLCRNKKPVWSFLIAAAKYKAHTCHLQGTYGNSTEDGILGRESPDIQMVRFDINEMSCALVCMSVCSYKEIEAFRISAMQSQPEPSPSPVLCSAPCWPRSVSGCWTPGTLRSSYWYFNPCASH